MLNLNSQQTRLQFRVIFVALDLNAI